MSDEEISTEILLEHYRSPHNYGKMENPSVEMLEYNPVCGDAIQMFLLVKQGIIEDVKFMGRGCSVSQASASMLTDRVKGKRLNEADSITPEDILEMVGLSLGPAREKCALLSYNTLKKCIKAVENKS